MELTAAARFLDTAFAGFDQACAIAVHKLFELAPWLFTPLLSIITWTGKDGIFLIVLGLALVVWKPTRKYGTVMLLGVIVGALITNLVFKPLVARPRPYTHEGSVYYQFWEQLGRHTESDKSFPSGHMTAAMAVSTALFLFFEDKKKGWPIFIYAFLMGVSRIYLSVHYTTDVIGGTFAGAVGGTAGWFLLRFVPEWFYDYDFTRLLPGYHQQGKHLAKPAKPAPEEDDEAEEDVREIVIDGESFSDLRGFLIATSEALGVPEEDRARNLDALNDLLRGGFTDDDALPKHIRWLNAEKSRADLGYEATAAYFELMLKRAKPERAEKIRKRMDAAKAHEGDTLFDTVLRLFERAECSVSLE